MKRRTWIAVAFAVAALIVAGGLYASNMGFKLNYTLNNDLDGAGPDTGLNSIALPYFRQVGIDNAAQLETDIGAAQVTNISRFNRANNTLITYPPTSFSLVSGEGYRVQMSSSVNYIIVGSHDPGLSITLFNDQDAGGPDTGLNDFAPPYHTTAVNAAQLETEIGAAQVTNISRFNRANNTLITYPPTSFNLVPGESYRIQMGTSVTFIPSHY
jgi:hypothetical protein